MSLVMSEDSVHRSSVCYSPKARDANGRAVKQINDTAVIELHAAKSSTGAIAKALGVHKSTVLAAFKRLGLTSHFGRRVNTGDRFGRYTVLQEVEPSVSGRGVRVRRVLARCECGTEKTVRLSSLVEGTTVSCGCYHAELAAEVLPKACVTHGMSRTPLHRIWCAMKARCTNPANKRWENYGGRGIRVCDEWMNSFAAFAAYVGPKPDGMSLDRINNDGNYEPGNVRWATYTEQANNRRPRRVQP